MSLYRLAPCLALAACGGELPLESTSAPIIEGTPSAATDYPATAAIIGIERFMGDEYGFVMCSATLIAPDVALTAAHCIVDEAAIQQELPGLQLDTYLSFELDLSRFGLDGTTLPADSIPIAGAVQHPNYDALAEGPPGLGADADIGLLFLGSHVRQVNPATLPDTAAVADVQVGAPVIIAGYGQRERSYDSQVAGARYHASTFIQETNDYEMQVGGTIDSTTVGPSKCYGDSGGPTYLERGGTLVVVGVTSRSYNQHEDCDEAGIDTRVDPFLGWIEIELENACAQGTRSDCGETPKPDPDPMPDPTEPDPEPTPDPTMDPDPAPESPAPQPTPAMDEPRTRPKPQPIETSDSAGGCAATQPGDVLPSLLLVAFVPLVRRRRR